MHGGFEKTDHNITKGLELVSLNAKKWRQCILEPNTVSKCVDSASDWLNIGNKVELRCNDLQIHTIPTGDNFLQSQTIVVIRSTYRDHIREVRQGVVLEACNKALATLDCRLRLVVRA